MSEVIAILTADLHLSHTPPVARSAEPDWYAAQARPLKQLGELARKHQVDIFCAGDLLHRWCSVPELINWTIDHLPPMYSIPGQHDLPHHSYEDIKKSAYWSVVQSGVVQAVEGDLCWMGDRLAMKMFPWGWEVVPLEYRKQDGVYVALIHRYLWLEGVGYPGASADTHASTLEGSLKGYDVAVFGDNHKSFETRVGDCKLFNCGCLIPRSIDERQHRPSVGLLKDDKSIERHYLDTSEDRWLDEVSVPGEDVEQSAGLDEFLTELKGLDSTSLDFRVAVQRYIRDNADVDGETKKVLVDVLERGGGG